MSAEAELEQIKKILTQIRDSNVATSTSVNAADVDRYTSELKIARQELELLDKNTAAYNRKLREVESLSRQARNAMKDHRNETDLLSMSTRGLIGVFDTLANVADRAITAIGGVVKSFMDEAKALDNITMQFRATTGATADLASNIGALSDRLRIYGINAEKAGQIQETLAAQFTLFTTLNKEQQLELGRTVGFLGDLGISFEQSAGILETATRTLNMSLGDTEQLLIDMRGMSRDLQIPIEQLTRDFAAAEGTVVALGDGGVDAFKKLSATAKGTGVEVSTLLGITKQFDTFEGAAQSVQALNTLLQGPYLDSITMINTTDPSERINLIRGAFEAAGKGVEDLADAQHYYLKESLAAGLNTDVPTLMKLLSGETDELQESALNAGMSLKELSDEAFGLKGFDEILNNVVKGLQKPVSQIQQAARRSFEGFQPLLESFNRYNESLIESTTAFVDRNSKLVGAVGLIYNLGNIDAVQKGYDIFKGMADFTGSMLSNMFTFKGLLTLMAGGVLYSIRGDLGDIYDAFFGPKGGLFKGLSKTFDVLSDKFTEFKKNAVSMGFDQDFFDALLEKGIAFSKRMFATLEKFLLGPLIDFLSVDGVFYFEKIAFAIGMSLRKVMESILSPFAQSILLADEDEIEAPRTRKEIEEAYKKQTGGDHARRLQRQRELIKATLEDKLATRDLMQGRGAKGMAEVDKRFTDVVTAVSPVMKSIKDTITDLAVDAYDLARTDGVEAAKQGAILAQEISAASNQSHDNYFQVNIGNKQLESEVVQITESRLQKQIRDGVVR